MLAADVAFGEHAPTEFTVRIATAVIGVPYELRLLSHMARTEAR
jgi:ABC-type Fe3+-siderophore transport system permease subunit